MPARPTPNRARRGLAAVLGVMVLAPALPAPAAAQVSILGPCREGHRWAASAAGSTPWAIYGLCQSDQALVVVTCGGTWPELRIAHSDDGAADPQVRRLTVDGAEMELPRATTGHHDGQGGTYARVPLHESVLRALTAGNRAVLQIGATQLEMHLGASHDALGLVSRHC